MNSKERINLALNHQTTDRIPLGNLCGGINPPAFREFDLYLKRNKGIDAQSYINSMLDLTEVHSFEIMPGYDYANDCWGVKRKEVNFGNGSYLEIDHYPLQSATTIKEINDYKWPQTHWFDYSLVKSQVLEKKAGTDMVIAVSLANIFESAWYMRGLEQIFMDMMTQPDIFHAMMDKITVFFIEHFKSYIQASEGEVEIAFTGDDIGSQKGLLLSLDAWEEFIKPYHVRLNNELHGLGVKIAYHSCGSVIDAIDGLIDMGIDILESVQTNAEGMDPVKLKQKAGKKLCFEGGICVQKILPFGSLNDVAETTRHMIDILGRDGGYIVGPSHYIQAGTPPENIEMMFETAKTYYPH